jgi:hypothetical protein
MVGGAGIFHSISDMSVMRLFETKNIRIIWIIKKI